jgi:predicted amidohydrolase YtcJ
VRAWLDEGAHLSAGTDYPIGFFNPLQSVWGMVTRQTEQLGIQGPEYAIEQSTATWLASAATAEAQGPGKLDKRRCAERLLAELRYGVTGLPTHDFARCAASAASGGAST